MRKLIFFVCLFFISCKKEVKIFPKQNTITKKIFGDTSSKSKTILKNTVNDTTFVNIKSISNNFVLDLKYATTNNFLHKKVYNCPDCYLRYQTAQALNRANIDFIKQGFKIKLFDCYRPLDVQKKMWQILPGTNYVANPAKGSKHNKGAAVDLTLVDALGNELNMGTGFDFFGPEAHHTFTNHSKEVLRNRKILKETLEKYNFKSIYNEWWHYEYIPQRQAKVSNFKWKCP